MSFRIYIENLSGVISSRVFYTFRGLSLTELDAELRQMLTIPSSVRLDIYDKRFGCSNRQLVTSLDSMSPQQESLHVFLRKIC